MDAVVVNNGRGFLQRGWPRTGSLRCVFMLPQDSKRAGYDRHRDRVAFQEEKAA